MAKDTFYFSHDYNTRLDTKIKKLLKKHKAEGYGIYWMIVEDLYNNANALETDYEGIAYDMRINEDLIKSIINDFDLFIVKNGVFGSESIEKRLAKRAKKSSKARESAMYRWNKDNANALRTQSDSNAIKERKVKDNKIKDSIISIEDAYDFLKNKEPEKIELFEMQNKKDFPDYNVFTTNFNSIIIENDIMWEPKVLLARLYRLNINWDKTPKKNRDEKDPTAIENLDEALKLKPNYGS